MEKCKLCGADAYGFIDASGAGIYKCGSTDHGFDPEHPEPFVSVLCLRRQLAALKAENQTIHHNWMADHAELERLKDELAHTEPMVPRRLFDAAVEAIKAYIDADRDGTEEDVEAAGEAMDAAIRAAREGER